MEYRRVRRTNASFAVRSARSREGDSGKGRSLGAEKQLVLVLRFCISNQARTEDVYFTLLLSRENVIISQENIMRQQNDQCLLHMLHPYGLSQQTISLNIFLKHLKKHF